LGENLNHQHPTSYFEDEDERDYAENNLPLMLQISQNPSSLMKIKSLWLALAALLSSVAAVGATNESVASLFTNVPRAVTAVPRRPSIIFIQCHDLAAGDLSCYGQTNYQTPNLDRLAGEGVRFTKYSGGAESPETTAMLLAGKAGVTEPGATNLARLLKLGGYHTGLIGEWTFDRTPWMDGFDEFAGFFTDAEARDYYADAIWRYPHIIYDESNRVQKVFLDHEMLYHNAEGNKGQYLPELLLNAAANFARINAPDAANRYRPFFLLVNLPAPRSASAEKSVFPVPSDAPYTGEPWPQAAKDRAALMTRLDGGIGRLFEEMSKAGLTNNVAVIFSSSCAPEKFADTNLNFLLPRDHFRGTNNAAPPRLPLIVHFPAKIPGGRVVDAPLTTPDLAPTLLELGYAKPATNFTGRSVWPMLQGREKKKQNPQGD
jgi:arylsulfatase A-like enzyme